MASVIPKNGYNPDVLIHRCYGAVEIGGKIYGVKLTLKENVKNTDQKQAYSYGNRAVSRSND